MTQFTAHEVVLDARVAEKPAIVRWYLGHERLIVGVASFVAFFALWELASTLGWISKFFFSSPSSVAAAGWAEIQNPRLWNDFLVSGTELVVGYGAAVLLGVPLGILAGWYRRFNYLVDPWLSFLYATPRVALLPLIVLWVGIGIESKILIVFLGAWLTIIINTLYGIRTVDRRLLDVATAYGASQRRVFSSVVLPGAMPFIIAGLRLGVGRALIGVVVGELYAASAGIGYMITVASVTLQTSRLLFGVLLLTFMGVFLVELIRIIERRVQRWRPAVGSLA